MTLQTLEYFIAVAQHRNFTQAARACHVTQPALSRAVHALEEELAADPFDEMFWDGMEDAPDDGAEER